MSLKQKQFIENEVKPLVREVIPELIDTMENLTKITTKLVQNVNKLKALDGK
ncbi:MAG: hypothetical protein GY841_23590 [FCB group bacterium]|nr:hypothetical protein [FCB group bacterium]